jgi:hypothetical protein
VNAAKGNLHENGLRGNYFFAILIHRQHLKGQKMQKLLMEKWRGEIALFIACTKTSLPL